MLIFWPCGALLPAVRHDDLANIGKLAWGMTMAARPLSLSLHTYAMNLTYGLVGAALLHRQVRMQGIFLEAYHLMLLLLR